MKGSHLSMCCRLVGGVTGRCMWVEMNKSRGLGTQGPVCLKRILVLSRSLVVQGNVLVFNWNGNLTTYASVLYSGQ